MDCHGYRLDQMLSILALLPNLRKLHVYRLHLPRPSDFMVLADALADHPFLRSMHLAACNGASDEVVLKLVRLQAGLQVLELLYCHRVKLSTIVDIIILHLLPAGPLLLVDSSVMDQLVEASRSNVLLRKQIKKGKVQDADKYRILKFSTV